MCRANILMTETFDSGLLGEHVLNTLSDAWSRLIATDLQVCLSVLLFVCLPSHLWLTLDLCV